MSRRSSKLTVPSFGPGRSCPYCTAFADARAIVPLIDVIARARQLDQDRVTRALLAAAACWRAIVAEYDGEPFGRDAFVRDAAMAAANEEDAHGQHTH